MFVHNIGGLLYHPTNQPRTNAVVQESQQRRLEGPPVTRTPQATQHPSLHHHSLQTPVPPHLAQPPHTMASQPGGGRPALDRAHTFPTPPASASSLMGITNQGNSYEWGSQGMSSGVPHSQQPLSIDTSLSNARSMPTTPATTPPGSNLQGMQFQGSQPPYDSSKPYYSTAPPSHPQYAAPSLASYGQQNLPSAATYMKNDMGPPSARAPGAPSSEVEAGGDAKDRYSQSNGPTTGEGGVPEQESDYVHDHGAGYNNAHRGSYTYTTNASVNTLTGEHSQLTPELSSPSQQNGSGRMTPRTGGGPPPQWASGYNTPPRPPATSSLYNIVSDTRGTPANGAPSDSYSVTSNSGPAYSSGMNGSLGSSGTKRMREDDEEDDTIRPDSRGTDYDGKRRRTITEVNGGPLAGPPLGMQPLTAGGAMPRRR